jgi:methylglutaconyl-CoA hydratase
VNTASSPLVEERRDDLLFLRMADPARANALSPALAEALTAAYRRPLREEGIRAIILSGEGRHFCGGADLDHLKTLRGASYEENLADSQRLRGLFEAILRQEALTVAVVQGSCVAGGCGVATAHDFVVAAEDARFLYSEARIGFVAALVATFLPLRLKGRDIRELLLAPQFLFAKRALEIGLVNRIVASEELAGAGEKLAAEILAESSGESIARTKRLMLSILGRPLGQALDLAAEANADARSTDDCKRGIDTFLESKKTPVWR